MIQAPHQLAQAARNSWKRSLIYATLALLTAIPIIFFILQPILLLSIKHLEEVLYLALFLLSALIFSYRNTRLQKQAHEAIQKLHSQTEEINRREYELRIFSDIVREIREEKDLKRQLSHIAQTIDNAFSIYGIRDCIFLMPNIEGTSLQPMIATQSTLSHEEEASAIWAIQQSQSLELRPIPLIVRARGSYVRWIVTNRAVENSMDQSASYIVPLLSRSKTIGGIRLLIEDTTHPRFLSIKKSLERHACGLPDPEPDPFLDFLNHAISLIEQELIERALRNGEEEQLELGHRIEEFYRSIISSVSHDLQTPLALIKGDAISLLDQRETWNDEAERRAVLTEVISEANRLELFINRMLDISRIEQGKLKIEKELYPIETIVLDTLELKHIQALLQDRHIEKSGLEDLPPVELDPILIGQVLGNLLENAARYTPTGSPIEIDGRTDGEHIVLSIIDCGPGIPATEKERIFEKFHRISRTMEKEETIPLDAPFGPSVQGIGLGLAICRGCVEAHQGHIWVENLDSGGAKFQFTLPLKQKRGSI